MGLASNSLQRHFSLQLVDEVFEEDHVVLRLLRFRRIHRHQRRDALPIQGEIHISARAPGDTEMHPMEMASFRKLFK